MRDLIGTPWDCPCDPPYSYDCWALVVEVRKRLGLPTPVYADATASGLQGRALIKEPPTRWRRLEAPEQGCVARLGLKANHVGVVLPNGDVIHSKHGLGVCVDRMSMLPGFGSRMTYWEYDDA